VGATFSLHAQNFTIYMPEFMKLLKLPHRRKRYLNDTSYKVLKQRVPIHTTFFTIQKLAILPTECLLFFLYSCQSKDGLFLQTALTTWSL
jgi:hypothetical protein